LCIAVVARVIVSFGRRVFAATLARRDFWPCCCDTPSLIRERDCPAACSRASLSASRASSV
jgi:hypothetical protein